MGRSPFRADAPCGHSHRWLDTPRSSGLTKYVLKGGFEDGGDCDDLIDQKNQESLHELHEAEMKADAEVEMDESRPHREPAEKVFISKKYFISEGFQYLRLKHACSDDRRHCSTFWGLSF